jgi:hypothetical protein
MFPKANAQTKLSTTTAVGDAAEQLGWTSCKERACACWRAIIEPLDEAAAKSI